MSAPEDIFTGKTKGAKLRDEALDSDSLEQESPEQEMFAAITSPSEIPDRLYFRIGDVARLAGIKPYVLRFWETEFPALGPKKSGTGHRLFRRKDVELVLEIKRLLYEKRYTIEGARKHLESYSKQEASKTPAKAPKRKKKEQANLFGSDPTPALEKIRKELQAIAEMLK
jgi:DNA-binding transcriptional MerR regulator